MLRILRILTALTVVILSSYSLLTDSYSFLTLSQFFIGLLFFIIAVEQIKKHNKSTGFTCIVVGVFV
ncbi:DUF3953 domain-containing protein [Bacillus bingmayongensis]|uniref:DUF3953 domain-containing protein n=1 Tax=Bacillus bingmayongensis TaxID=1150157 RepID=UPI0009DA0BD4|nr:DUF3953 domain-containing protein [Bacillus bingmayongensis]MBY0599729.1 DUF3292 domain-containing protein [Bacillus bingmayongensis]